MPNQKKTRTSNKNKKKKKLFRAKRLQEKSDKWKRKAKKYRTRAEQLHVKINRKNKKLKQILTEKEDLNQKLEESESGKKNTEKKILELEAEIKRLHQQLQSLSSDPLPISTTLTHSAAPLTKDWVRCFCAFLFIKAMLSGRSIIQTIQCLLRMNGIAGNIWIPHFTSIFNWVARAGLGVLKQVQELCEPWVAILDTSITQGENKVLFILRVKLSHYLCHPGKALALKDVSCIGMSIESSLNGEIVAQRLEDVFAQAGNPIAILKDGGSDLKRGTEIWKENHPDVIVLEDVGHRAANAMKRKYQKQKRFRFFLRKMCSLRARLCQTRLSFIRPAPIRTKGRFQSISRLAKWSKKMKQILDNSHRHSSLLEKISKKDADTKRASTTKTASITLEDLKQELATVQPISTQLVEDCEVIDAFLKFLKEEGLNSETAPKALEILQQLPKNSSIREELTSWLGRQLSQVVHLHLQLKNHVNPNIRKLAAVPLPVSTDVIESLMGKVKTLLARNPIPEFTKIALGFPLLCGEFSEEMLLEKILTTFQNEIIKWQMDHCQNTHRRKNKQLTELLNLNSG